MGLKLNSMPRRMRTLLRVSQEGMTAQQLAERLKTPNVSYLTSLLRDMPDAYIDRYDTHEMQGHKTYRAVWMVVIPPPDTPPPDDYTPGTFTTKAHFAQRALTDDQIAHARLMLDVGHSRYRVAKVFGISPTTLRAALNGTGAYALKGST